MLVGISRMKENVLDFTFNTIRCDKKLVYVIILTNHKIVQFGI